jgi:dolichol-phosphate mannosyltransferase
MTTESQRRTISVIVPVLNEEAGIEALRSKLSCLEGIFGALTSLEFVFVDDGSTDRTRERLESAFGGGTSCRIVSHPTNQGVGAAFRTGFAHATGSIVCTIDADCTYEPESLKDLVNVLDSTGADIAVASPYHPEGKIEDIVGWRIFVSKVCSAIYRLVSPVKLYTYTSIFRAYRRAVTKTVSFEANGFVSAAEIIIRASQQGYQVAELPMTLRGRRVGTSKMRILRTIRTHLGMMAEVVRREIKQHIAGAGEERRSTYAGTASGLAAGRIEPTRSAASVSLSGKE